MTKSQATFGLSTLLPLLAAAMFWVFSPPMAEPVSAGKAACDPGICMANGCSEKAQYCNSDGQSWGACGAC